MLAGLPSCKLITESVREMVVIPVEFVETILPRSPTCLVDDVGLPWFVYKETFLRIYDQFKLSYLNVYCINLPDSSSTA